MYAICISCSLSDHFIIIYKFTITHIEDVDPMVQQKNAYGSGGAAKSSDTLIWKTMKKKTHPSAASSAVRAAPPTSKIGLIGVVYQSVEPKKKRCNLDENW